MFTGIIQALGTVLASESRGGDLYLQIDMADLDLGDANLGDSIAVNGVCLTAVEFTANGFAADVSRETLECTTLGRLSKGASVNLEPALRASDRLGGHLVSGHVDGIGQLLRRYPDGRSERLEFEAPGELARYIAAKGSICIDGTSLTVNHVDGAGFGVNIVPHTAKQTIIGDYRPGQSVNLEVDLIARYLERLMQGEGNLQRPDAADGGLLDKLMSADFL